MSTVCKICIRTSEVEAVETIRQYLQSNNQFYTEENSEWPWASDVKKNI